MKIKIILLIVLSFSFLYQTFALDIFDTNSKVMYCDDPNECGIEEGANSIKNELNTNTDAKASDYIQNVVLYILTFVTLIGVLYIIYAGFRHLTSAGDEETAENTKKIILSVFIGLLIIWLSYAIIRFFMDILNAGDKKTNITTNTTTN